MQHGDLIAKVAEMYSIDEFSVQEGYSIKGRSGANHKFDLVVSSTDTRDVTLAVLNGLPKTTIEDIMMFNAFAEDCGIELKVFTTDRDLKEPEANLLKIYGISIFDRRSLNGENFLVGPSVNGVHNGNHKEFPTDAERPGNLTMKRIFRSWNWPDGGLAKFSHRPTPYRIGRDYDISTSSVYDEWHELFDGGVVDRVILRPADRVVHRRRVIFTNVNYGDFSTVRSRMERLYFLEFLHFGHVYESSGVLKDLVKSPNIIGAELVNSSSQLAPIQADLISEFMGSNAGMVDISYQDLPNDLDDKLNALSNYLSYSSLYDTSIGEMASWMNVSHRTAERRMDALLERRAIMAYPLLNQSILKGFEVAKAYGIPGKGASMDQMKSLLSKMPHLSQKYLLYEFMNKAMTLLFYYDSTGELDACAKELDSVFDSFLLMTKFETSFNGNVVTNSKPSNGRSIKSPYD